MTGLYLARCRTHVGSLARQTHRHAVQAADRQLCRGQSGTECQCGGRLGCSRWRGGFVTSLDRVGVAEPKLQASCSINRLTMSMMIGMIDFFMADLITIIGDTDCGHKCYSIRPDLFQVQGTVYTGCPSEIIPIHGA